MSDTAIRHVGVNEPVTITLADGTILPDCRPDLLSIGDLMARGWSIIPLQARSKIPAMKWEPYQRRLATLEELEEWFTHPGANVGVVTGKISGIFVVDCDSPEALAWAGEKLPIGTMRVRTAKGLHLYYPYSGERADCRYREPVRRPQGRCREQQRRCPGRRGASPIGRSQRACGGCCAS